VTYCCTVSEFMILRPKEEDFESLYRRGVPPHAPTSKGKFTAWSLQQHYTKIHRV